MISVVGRAWLGRPWPRRLGGVLLLAFVWLLGLPPVFDPSFTWRGQNWSVLGLSVVARLGLVVLQTRPVVAFVSQWAYVLVIVALFESQVSDMIIDVGLLLALWSVARHCRTRISVTAYVMGLIPWGWEVALEGGHFDLGTLLQGLLGAGILAVVWMLGYWRRMVVSARSAAVVAEEARRAERLQTARELHGVVSHTVTAMLVQAAGARAVLDVHPDRVRPALDAVQEAGVRAMAELRRMLVVLRLDGPVDVARWPGTGYLLRLADVALVGVAFLIDDYVWIHDSPVASTIWGTPELDAAVLVALLWRWRLPEAVFVLQFVYAVTLVRSDHESNFVAGLLIALHAVARQCNPWTSVAAALVCVGELAWMSAHENPFHPFVLVGIGVPVAAVWTVGYWMRQFTLAREKQKTLDETRRAEKLRTSQELHDIVSHTVTVMLLQAAGARAVLDVDPEKARHALDAVQDAGVQAMAELERLLVALGLSGGGEEADSEPEASDLVGLDRVEHLVDTMRDAGLAVEVQAIGTPARLDTSVDVTAYRVVQEALTNSSKHAGSECVVDVRLEWCDDSLLITVADHGGEGRWRKRALVPSTGHGLIGLSERVTAIGGQLVAEPRADGFVVTATLPAA